MNNNCINLKQKLNRSLYCIKKQQIINTTECKNCKYKQYKTTINKQSLYKNSKPLKQKSSKLAKLERNRSSLFTDDLKHCIICGKSPVNIHEVFGGKNRQRSIKYKLVIPLCTCEHHNQIEMKGIHFEKDMQDYWHKEGQKIFNKHYPTLDFIEVFGKNYCIKK